MAANQHTDSYSVSRGTLADEALVARWNALCSASAQHSPFSSPHYARGLSETLRYTPTIFIVSYEQKDLAGVLTYSREQGFFKRATIPPFTSFVSLIAPTASLPATTNSALRPYRLLLEKLEEEFDSIRLHHHPSLKDIRIFQWNRWESSPLYTYQIDLTVSGADPSQWSTSTRRTYRKYSSRYHFQEDSSSIPEAIALCQKSYSRHHRVFPATAERLQSFAEYLASHGMIRIFTLTPLTENKPTAALALLHDREVAYYWMAGSVPGHAMTVLIGKLLASLKKEGMRLFDFVGANTQSVAEFKRRFGPTLTPYYAVSCCPNRLLATLRCLKRAVRD